VVERREGVKRPVLRSEGVTGEEERGKEHQGEGRRG